MEKGQKVMIINETIRELFELAEIIFGSGKKPHCEGVLIAVHPTKEEYASLHIDFKNIVENGGWTEEISEGVIFYDEGAERPFWVEEKEVEVIDHA